MREAYKEKMFGIIDEFIAGETDLGKDNANYVRSLPVMETLLKGNVCRNYLFDIILEGLPISDLHDSGFLYMHQTSSLSAYCIGLSSYDLAMKGLKSNAKNERAAAPSNRIESLLNQAANLICLLAQEVSGATSINDLSTVLAGYLYVLEQERGMKYDRKYLENCWQSFLYNVNLPFRSGNSPFSNVTLDFGKPAATLAHRLIVFQGKVHKSLMYSDIPGEFYDRINEAFIDAMLKGDSIGHPFTFPLITVNITDDFDYNVESWKYLLEASDKFGGFYIQNYCQKPFTAESRKINPYNHPYSITQLYSNCCRLTLDLEELMNVTGSNPFASGSGIGGVGVVAINLNRCLWLSQGKEELLFPMLDYLFTMSVEALERKRDWLRGKWKGLYPYLSYYVKDDTSLFSILSILGMHEGLKGCGFENGIYDEEGKALAHKVGNWCRNKTEELSKKFISPVTLEFAPSEFASVLLANKDLAFADELLTGTQSGDEIKWRPIHEFGKEGESWFTKHINTCVEENMKSLFKEV